MSDDTLFDDDDVDQRPDPAVRQAVRRLVLGGILQVVRTRNAWSVNDAASAASIAPMTWRRVEEGLDVRKRTLTALDELLKQPFGTVRRALDDDLAMVALTQLADVDISEVSPTTAADFLDALAERFRTGTAVEVYRHDVNPLTREYTIRHAAGTVGINMRGLGVTQVPGARPAYRVRIPGPPVSDLTRAAELVDHISRRATTPALERAVKALLAAMPDLVTPNLDDAFEAVNRLSMNSDWAATAGKVAQRATDAAIVDAAQTAQRKAAELEAERKAEDT